MDKLITALIAAQKKISNANRTAMNEFFKSAKKKSGSPYATLEDVIQAVKEPLLEQGILYQQISEQVEGGVCIETVFYGHGAKLETGKYFVPADKQTPHGYGSALTYARRYSLSSACGIGAADDDGNDAEIATAKKPAPKPKPDTKAEPDEKADAQQAKYLFFSDEDQSQVLATAIDEDILLEVLRNFLKKPETPKAQELFKINKEMILKATVSAEGDTKEALTMMQRLFEKEIAKGELK